MIETLQKLVSLSSVSGDERLILDYIYQKVRPEFRLAKKTNQYVCAKIPGNDNSQTLVFCGHVDTVHPGPQTNWETNPLRPELKRGKLYGLGAADMKAGVAVMLELLKDYAAAPPPLDLWFVFVGGEEVDGRGSRAFMADYGSTLQAYEQASVVLPEPTPDNIYFYGCKGTFFAELVVSGVSGHAADPPDRLSQTLYKASQLLADITLLEKDWQKNYHNYSLGRPTITPTSIVGQSGSPNKLTANCSITLDIRTVPEIDAQVKTLLAAWASQHDATIAPIAEHCPAALSTLDSGLIRKLDTLGFSPAVSLASSDLGCFTTAGLAACLIGPGDMAQAHQPNEFAKINELSKYFTVYKKLIESTGILETT